MTTYSLKFAFSQAGLSALSSSQEKVCVVKSVNGKVSNVVWLSIKPFLQNTITFNEAYGLYASNTQIQNGAKISRISNVASCSKGHQYPFLDAGYFGSANSSTVKGYGIINNYGEALTFGLTQTAIVNGKSVDSELNATTVLNNQMADYTPIVTLSIYVAASLNNGSVISDITGEPLTLTYTSGTEKIIHFDDTQNMFVEGEMSQ
ncbi:hypothetical protein DFA_12298 [Cavenderia fasciculata]|uniref:Uncharacterized protein n=1 Tax=Cavenderia fasciculata TaxID=261658 RepID=F4QD51_CACFS|nr:uncharacterized protein DFA_12298 [Cavenderia fasciculata]EGG14522.1 hypothetical protein DFA_12298 [Cavenderia fasciculata]|eukprot:XP_004366059.1 hypothetical protein DFA_12298 [Cavenderia fasciculata]